MAVVSLTAEARGETWTRLDQAGSLWFSFEARLHGVVGTNDPDLHVSDVRYYLIPVDQVGDYRGPKYFKWRFNPSGIDTKWSFRTYGDQPSGVIVADVNEYYHSYLDAQADVFTIPLDLETSPTPQELSAFESFLEAMYIPASWLNANDSWRTSLRTVVGMILFVRRLTAEAHEDPFTWGYSLNTRFDAMSLIHQVRVRAAFTSLGYDDAVIRDNWTLRVLWKNAADQWADRPILLGTDRQEKQIIL